MPNNRNKRRVALGLEALELREAPSVTPIAESFDTTPVGQLPAGWQQWSSSGKVVFTASDLKALSPTHSLLSNTATEQTAARTWVSTAEPADVQVGAALFVNNTVAAQVVARGSGLNTATPTYYGVAVTQGLEARLVRVQNGIGTDLAYISSNYTLYNQWVRVTLSVSGKTLRGQLYRLDTSQYLGAGGKWQSDPAWALTATDTQVAGGASVGVARASGNSGALFFDDFRVDPPAGDTQPPTVAFTNLSSGAVLTGVRTIQVTATDPAGINQVAFYVDGGLRAVTTQAPYSWAFDSSSASNGSHTLTARARDIAGNTADATVTVTTSNSNALPDPQLPQHYSWIRVAELAYGSNQIGAFEQNLLKNSIDLVVTQGGSTASLVSAAAPGTTQLLYTNVSSLYGSLLTNWLAYADRNGYSREDAFYHVTQPRSYSGTSPSSQPVNWFWKVYRDGPYPADLTVSSRNSLDQSNTFGSSGQSVYVGYTDKFREINIDLTARGASTWSEVLQYPTAVDASGNPTAWATLPLLQDGTAGVTRSGRIAFDPPADWKTASVGGSARLYFVRFLTTGTGAAPYARSILGRDYTSSYGANSGVVPVFDTAADANHDGYLSDAEYAKRAPGKDARFLYESRAPMDNYGEMRFATNPSNGNLRSWVVDYNKWVLQSQPQSVGLFLDNSAANPPFTGPVRESVTSYGDDYASLLNALTRAVAGRVVLANTFANSVIRNTTGFYEEFALKPLADTYQQLEALAAWVAQAEAVRTPSPYAVLDVSAQGGSPTDPRTQLAALAYYYLLGDPTRTFVNFFGGDEPSTSWTRHWVQAAAYNVGQPLGPLQVFATGRDPTNSDYTYKIYERQYANALVLYKPLSAYSMWSGSTGSATATYTALGGNYRQLNSDGTLGSVVTSISLRNGEGAILIKA